MVSPAPAPTESSAMRGRPLSRPLRSSGWTISSFWPSNEGVLMVQTTLPMTRPSCMLLFSRGGEFGLVQRVEPSLVHDADDGSVHGAVPALGGVARRAAGNHQHGFAESRVHRVHGNQVAGFINAFWRNRFNDEEFLAFEPRIFPRRNHCADDAGQNHEGCGNFKSDFSAGEAWRHRAIWCTGSQQVAEPRAVSVPQPSPSCRWAARLR